MAKSKSFFGLRRGSTKSLTFSVYRGQQVTKDRVSEVANPQSSMQMKQRLLVPLVASARSTLKTLVDHSFEGMAYGDASLKEFSRLNLQKDALKVASYVPKGAMDSGLANFIISRGSLPVQSVEADGEVTESGGFSSVKATSLVAPGAPSSPYQSTKLTKEMVDAILAKNPTLQRGDQLTFLICFAAGRYNYPVNASENAKAHYHNFCISRLILDETVENNWRYQVAEKSLQDGYMQLKCFDDANFTFSAALYDPAVDTIEAACVILSRKDGNNWRRSSQRLNVLVKTDTPTFDQAQYSYLKSQSASSKYLNAGPDGVSIVGGGRD